ncbi:hypothetical protein CRYUN_Cryun23aG0137100 [Craigia yunnanensis]
MIVVCVDKALRHAKNQKKCAKIADTKEYELQNAEEKINPSSAGSSPTMKLMENQLHSTSALISPLEAAELHPAPSSLISEGGDYPPIQSFADAKNICFIESSKLWAIATPIAFNIWCNYGINSFTSIFVGHIGDIELSAVAIALSVVANFSFGFKLGMASALDTLCGQAFGAGQIDLLGVYMQRSWIILFGACFALLPLYLYATPILKLLGQEPDIADLAGEFTMQVIPQMFSLAINFPTQKFLQAQSKWGTVGAAAAYDISAWAIAVAQVIYVVRWCKEGWTGLSWLAFKDLWGFVKLSVASAVMLCLEIWYFMTIIVLTGHLEDPIIAVGSLSICMNINGWEGMLFIGINAAISVRVSNELGSAHPRAAKYSVFVTVVQSLLIGILSAVIILATRNKFAIIFTDSKEMQKAVAHLAHFLASPWW